MGVKLRLQNYLTKESGASERASPHQSHPKHEAGKTPDLAALVTEVTACYAFRNCPKDFFFDTSESRNAGNRIYNAVIGTI